MSDDVKAAAERLLEIHTEMTLSGVLCGWCARCGGASLGWPCDTVTVARYALEAGQEVAGLHAALLEFIHAYANVERLDHDGVEVELFKAWMRGCWVLGIKAEGHRAALSAPGGPESIDPPPRCVDCGRNAKNHPPAYESHRINYGGTR